MDSQGLSLTAAAPSALASRLAGAAKRVRGGHLGIKKETVNGSLREPFIRSKVRLNKPMPTKQYNLSKLTAEQIEQLSDDEILSYAMPRPGHPGQRGFLLNPQYFRNQEHLARTMHALLTRLGKVLSR